MASVPTCDQPSMADPLDVKPFTMVIRSWEASSTRGRAQLSLSTMAKWPMTPPLSNDEMAQQVGTSQRSMKMPPTKGIDCCVPRQATKTHAAKQAVRQTHRHTNTDTHTQNGRQSDSQTDTDTHKTQTDRRTDRNTKRETDIQTENKGARRKRD